MPCHIPRLLKQPQKWWSPVAKKKRTSLDKISCKENVLRQKESRKFCPCHSRSSNYAIFGLFTVLFCREIQWPKPHVQGYCWTHYVLPYCRRGPLFCKRKNRFFDTINQSINQSKHKDGIAILEYSRIYSYSGIRSIERTLRFQRLLF